MGGYPGLLGWGHCNPYVLIKGREEGQGQSQRETLEDVTLMALKMEDGISSQGLKVVLEAGKGKATDSFIQPPGGTLPC